MSLFAELQRRNVFRVAVAYVIFAWLLIQVAETIFPLFGFGDAPARLIVIALAIAFLPILVFAWAFELTPEGLKLDKDVDRSQSITPQTGRTLDRIIMVALALALDLNEMPGVFALAADTDGIDGTQDNAGAVVTPDTLARARSLGLEPRVMLDNNDGYSFFEALSDLVKTGPTLTNVNDFRAIYIAGRDDNS